MLRNGIWTLFYRVIGAALTLFATILFARILGAPEFGLFNLGITTITIVCLFVRSGLDNVALKQVSAYFPEKKEIAEGYITVILKLVFGLSVFFTMLIWAMAEIIAITIFNKPEFEGVLKLLCLLIAPMSLSYVLSDIYKAIGRPKFSAFSHGVLPILTTLILVCFIPVDDKYQLSKILIATVTGFLVSCIVYMYNIRAYLFSQSKNCLTYFGTLKEGIPMLLVSSGALVMAWSDVIILGVFSTADNIGIYTAASRVVMATTLILMAVNAVVVPKYSNYYKKGDVSAIEKLARVSASILLLAVIFPTMLLILFGDWVMLFFGNEFSEGAKVLKVLAVGQFVNVVCGSVAYLLIMTGKEKELRNIYIVTAVINIFLSILLLKIWGVIGVAYATAFSVILWNACAAYVVKKHLGFWTFKPASLMGLRKL